MGVAAHDTRGPRGPGKDDSEFDELRALLIGPERQKLAQLQARLDDPLTHARDVGAVLPQALHLRSNDPELSLALGPTVEQTITKSIRNDPRPWADALFPLMGPAIRKAVAASLASMVESLNRTLEHSLSWQAIQWRITAMRTGKSFAEIVLLNTLLYRVEQVFLIERESGLLLMHVHSGTAAVQDADMVSGMLTAIRDFVKDSFNVDAADSLEAFKVGDLAVWVEQGPHAALAAVIRGTAPQDVRRSLQNALELVHLDCAEAFAAFDGDTSKFEAARPILDNCLRMEYRADKQPRRRLVWVALGLVLVGLTLWAGLALRSRMQWSTYLSALEQQPGLVVVSTGRSGGRFFVNGLRDPLANDPALFLGESGLSPAQVVGRWTPYQALEPSIVVTRARELLRPPPGVAFALNDGALVITGNAPADWLMETQRLAPFVPGVRRVDASGVLDAAVRTFADRLAAVPVLFRKGTTDLAAAQDASLESINETLQELDAFAESTGRRLEVVVTGYADEDGPESANLPLSEARAARILNLLSETPTPSLAMSVSGRGSREPVVPGRSEADQQRNRRVVLRILPTNPGAPESAPR